jgi:uncharacterized membrane protein YhaH (DUF805 family)
MNFAQSLKTCFRKYANFKGRATRSEFWWFMLFTTGLSIAAMTLDGLLLGFSSDAVVTPFTTLMVALTIVPSASVTARRLHDIGWTGWVQLPVFAVYSAYLEIFLPGFSITGVGLTLMTIGLLWWFALLLLLIKDGQPNTNKYGPNPKLPEMGDVFS